MRVKECYHVNGQQVLKFRFLVGSYVLADVNSRPYLEVFIQRALTSES
jgi:hypothetical protein